MCTHGLQYALARPAGTIKKTEMNCAGCKFVPFFFDELRNAVTTANITHDCTPAGAPNAVVVGKEHALEAIARCEDLTSLWRGQCVRVANQRKAIAALHTAMETNCLEHKYVKPREAVVVMDYKMK